MTSQPGVTHWRTTGYAKFAITCRKPWLRLSFFLSSISGYLRWTPSHDRRIMSVICNSVFSFLLDGSVRHKNKGGVEPVDDKSNVEPFSPSGPVTYIVSYLSDLNTVRLFSTLLIIAVTAHSRSYNWTSTIPHIQYSASTEMMKYSWPVLVVVKSYLRWNKRKSSIFMKQNF